jgi:hypothetical protein
MGRVAGVEVMIRTRTILMTKPEKKKPKVATGGKMILKYIPYFSIDNARLMYNAHPKLFGHSF